jgi:asparagine synthase (glutamine-hydrolysing)
MPTYRVCELARKDVTVALSGDGGDENFIGYRRYRWHGIEEKMRRMVPDGLRMPLFGALGRLYPKADWAPKVFRAKTTFEALGRDTVAGYFHGVSVCSDTLRQRMFSDAFKKRLNGYNAVEVLRRHDRNNPSRDVYGQVQYLDMKTYLVGDILTKVDRASMSLGLEARVPLLDPRVAALAWRLPAGLKVRGGTGKWLLRRVLYRHVPAELVERPKSGFSVPLDAWLRGPLKEMAADLLAPGRLADQGLLDPEPIRSLWIAHQRGRVDAGQRLWHILALQLWLERWQ